MNEKRYAIMRMAKVKSMGDLVHSEKHSRRTETNPTKNIDKSRTKYNKSFYTKNGIRQDETVKDFFNRRVTKNVRKNAVYGIEMVFAYSPGAFETVDQIYYWAKANVKWLTKTFGAENIGAVDLHFDEESPHLHAIVIPAENGSLNARKFIGGKSNRMRELQSDYAEDMAQFGLCRGVKSDKTHKECMSPEKAHYLDVISSYREKADTYDAIVRGINKQPKEIRDKLLKQMEVLSNLGQEHEDIIL